MLSSFLIRDYAFAALMPAIDFLRFFFFHYAITIFLSFTYFFAAVIFFLTISHYFFRLPPLFHAMLISLPMPLMPPYFDVAASFMLLR